jgi:hypothetical protein
VWGKEKCVQVLVTKSAGKRQPGRPGKNSIKMDITKWHGTVWTGLIWLKIILNGELSSKR